MHLCMFSVCVCVYGKVHRKKKKQPRIQCHHHCSPKVSAQIQGNARKTEVSSFCLCSLESLVLGKRPSVLYLGIETLTKAMTSSFSGSNFSYKGVAYSCFQSFSMSALSQNYQLKIILKAKGIFLMRFGSTISLSSHSGHQIH